MKKYLPLIVITLITAILVFACSNESDDWAITVTFDANSGTGGTVSVTARYGELMPAITGEGPTRDGYIFAGFFDTRTGGTRYYDLALTPERNWGRQEDGTLYARWVQIGAAQTVNFDPNGGIGGPTSITALFWELMPAITTEAPMRDGYIFAGFFNTQTGGTKYYDANLTPVRNLDLDDGATLLARWAAMPDSSATYSVVSLVQSTNRDLATQLTYEDILALVREAVEFAGGLESIVAEGDTVVLKPNLVTSWSNWGGAGAHLNPLVNGVVTDWRVVQATAQIVREIVGPAGRILVMEGSASPYGANATTVNFNNLGFTAANLTYVDEIIALESEGTWHGPKQGSHPANLPYFTRVTLANPHYTTPSGGAWFGSAPFTAYFIYGVYYVSTRMYNADALISIPVLKHHGTTVITGSIKNVGIGAAPPRVYGVSATNIGRNAMVQHGSRHVCQFTADYFSVIPAHFTIVDALQGLEHGPVPQGNAAVTAAQKNMRSILASRDALAADIVQANIMNFNYSTIEHLMFVAERGEVGTHPDRPRIPVRGNPENISVRGNIRVDDIREHFAGGLPATSGSRLTAGQLAAPTVTIQSAVFADQNLVLNLAVSANTNTVAVYVNGDFAGRFSDVLDAIVLDASELSNGDNIMVYAYTRFMANAVAYTTVIR